MKRRIIPMVLLGILLSKNCLADNNITQVSRYQTVVNKPRYSQVYLLAQLVHVRFPQNTQTINEAINYLLRFSGYSLAPEIERDNAFKIILSKPLPIIDRELGPITLRDGLITLVSSAFDLTQDPIHRTVNFTLKLEYQKFMNTQRQSRGRA
jgi:conjugative transfer region protein (TIGR03748 family)